MTSETVVMRREANVFAYLIMVKGGRIGRVYRVAPDTTTIGRAADCQVLVDDPKASQQHAKIRSTGPEGPFVLHDLATTNGTRVNGQPIAEHELSSNDLLEIGDSAFVFKHLRRES